MEEEEIPISRAQKAQIERNRQKALLIRKARVAAQPHAPGKDKDVHRVKCPRKEVDTGAGFFIEDEEDSVKNHFVIKHQKGPALEHDKLFCVDCGKPFMDSFLTTNFDINVCDTCRSKEDKHNLITRTNAKTKYLLKDADLDKREPLLKFILKRNPHKSSWGDMKLYLESQVYSRALQVWGSEDKLVEARENLDDSRQKMKQKKYDKKVKELRMAVRSSLRKKTTGNHEHEYGEEVYDEDDDMYSKTCIACNHVMTYEKM